MLGTSSLSFLSQHLPAFNSNALGGSPAGIECKRRLTFAVAIARVADGVSKPPDFCTNEASDANRTKSDESAYLSVQQWLAQIENSVSISRENRHLTKQHVARPGTARHESHK